MAFAKSQTISVGSKHKLTEIQKLRTSLKASK
jgi:hypothetical protein